MKILSQKLFSIGLICLCCSLNVPQLQASASIAEGVLKRIYNSIGNFSSPVPGLEAREFQRVYCGLSTF